MEPAAPTKPEVKTLPRLDTEKVEHEAREWVDALMAGLETPEARAKAAADLERDEEKQAQRWAKKLEATVHTLTTAYWLRRGAGLAEAIGLPRSSLMVIRKRAAARGHDLVPDAPKVLPKVAYHAAIHSARQAYARKLRDAAALELVQDHGWTNAAAGELIGRDQSRISHLRHRDDDPEVAQAS
jgi:hypothetical protein